MLKKLLLTVTALLCIACNIQKKDSNIPEGNADGISFTINDAKIGIPETSIIDDNNTDDDEIGIPEVFIIDENVMKDIEDAHKALKENEIKEVTFRALLLTENILSGREIRAYDGYKISVPMGTYFWDEFSEYEAQYNLTDNESKLLGTWINTAMNTNPYYLSYTFFPNKLCVLSFSSGIYIFINNENRSLFRALGTWEIADGMVKMTIYSIEIEDKEKSYPNNKDIVLLEHPYTVDFIKIDDIGAEGYTKKPVYDRILSEELQRQLRVKISNTTNNLYLRNVYSIDFIPVTRKNFNYFAYFPEMAKEGHTGLEIATNPELIMKYIPEWIYY